MPKSISYHPSLISRLKNPEYAAAFITAILEEKEPEPELLNSALADVAEALGKQNKLNEMISNQNNAVYELANCLKDLGLKLTVSVDKNEVNPERVINNSVGAIATAPDRQSPNGCELV
ncbi:MAG: hypothetical protein KME17_01230 [Cyanosarcina radialis HA8281-LM2]|jgi:DNA-binding phage protein|nr:hypothetical protein [Cyanosarcina radialis HA8281-LM2]